ncbi:MAG: hypothetical protein QOE05_442 [Actinomycetota bacterium]|nr:hypothetical protein [Actinomycetota bacterium]
MHRWSPLGLLGLLSSLVVTVSSPASAAPVACSGGPLELATGEDIHQLAGQDLVQGYVLRRLLGGGKSCVVSDATVQLLARNAGEQSPRVVRTATTDAEGRVQFRVRPPYNAVLIARSASTDDFAATESAPVVVNAYTRVTIARRSLSGCRVAVSGRTFPAKPGTAVHVSSRPRPYEAVARGSATVRADGTWSGVITERCGADDPLFAWIGQTARNAPGDSEQVVAVATRTTTCGQGAINSGQMGTALRQTFEPFNTDTAVGGVWWGDRVVTNATDQTLSVEVQQGQVYELLRPGSTVLVGSNGSSDVVSTRSHQLAPGEEFREKVVLVAANCFATVPAGYTTLATSPGLAFPAGTKVAGRSVVGTTKGTSVSQRVALTVS